MTQQQGEAPRPPLPAVVVTAYNRPGSLARLLASLEAARYPEGVPLVISVDGGAPDTVMTLAQAFDWRAGPKTVCTMERNLGLKQHLLKCFDLTSNYGSVILLEDDFCVSPYFYEFGRRAVERYGADPRVAGISLFSHRFNETAGMPFAPIDDGYDVFFIQLASWGIIWTAQKWQAFRDWRSATEEHSFARALVPYDVRCWPKTSWKRDVIRYLIEKDLLFVSPRVSHVTNFGDVGVHYGNQRNIVQVELAGGPRVRNLPSVADSRAIYDAWCEMAPDLLVHALTPLVDPKDVAVDLFGTKDPKEQTTNYMLTTQRCSRAIARFGLRLRPREANILYGVEGNDIALAPTDCVRHRTGGTQKPFHEYVYGYDHLSASDLLGWLTNKILRRLRLAGRR